MKYFLVIVLLTGDVEQHVAIEMPTAELCAQVQEQFTFGIAYHGERKIASQVDEVRCEEARDE